MSAIDFDTVMERLPDSKGDSAKITMWGQPLPYKYYDSRGNVPEYGIPTLDVARLLLLSAHSQS